jgi:hypothetical protein
MTGTSGRPVSTSRKADRDCHLARPVATAVPSLWAPLRVAAFRALWWFAQLGTMLGVWMQTVGAQWLLVARPDSAALVPRT